MKDIVDCTTDPLEWNNYDGVKYGFGLNAKQEIANGIGLSSRINWSDVVLKIGLLLKSNGIYC